MSNVVLNVKLDGLLPGAPSIPEQIANDKKPYYDALEEADHAWATDKIDVSALESLLGDTLARQLADAIKRAAEAPAPPPRSRVKQKRCQRIKVGHPSFSKNVPASAMILRTSGGYGPFSGLGSGDMPLE